MVEGIGDVDVAGAIDGDIGRLVEIARPASGLAPHPQILAIERESLDTVVELVGDVDEATRIDGDAVGGVEEPWSSSFLSPGAQESAVGPELADGAAGVVGGIHVAGAVDGDAGEIAVLVGPRMEELQRVEWLEGARELLDAARVGDVDDTFMADGDIGGGAELARADPLCSPLPEELPGGRDLLDTMVAEVCNPHGVAEADAGPAGPVELAGAAPLRSPDQRDRRRRRGRLWRIRRMPAEELDQDDQNDQGNERGADGEKAGQDGVPLLFCQHRPGAGRY